MSLSISPFNLLGLFSANSGTFAKSTEVTNGMDGVARLFLPSAVACVTLFTKLSHSEKMTITTAVAGAHLFTSLDKRAISYIARGALLTTSFFWWKQGNYPLAIASLFVLTISCVVTECIYKPGETPEDRLQSVYSLSLPILWSLARTFLTPVKQAAVFAVLPLVFSGVEYKTAVMNDLTEYKSYYVINLGIAAAGVFFSAITAINSTSSFDRSALGLITLLNTAHIGIILFRGGKPGYKI